MLVITFLNFFFQLVLKTIPQPGSVLLKNMESIDTTTSSIMTQGRHPFMIGSNVNKIPVKVGRYFCYKIKILVGCCFRKKVFNPGCSSTGKTQQVRIRRMEKVKKYVQISCRCQHLRHLRKSPFGYLKKLTVLEVIQYVLFSDICQHQ